VELKIRIIKLKIQRKFLSAAIHLLSIVSAFFLAFFLRFDGGVPEIYLETLWGLLPWLVLIKFLVFLRMRLFSGWWKYVSLPDLLVIIKANIFASGVFLLYIVLFQHWNHFPRSIIILDFILCLLMTSGIRVIVRILREAYTLNLKERNDAQRVLIVGAGAVGQTIAREIRQSPHLTQTVSGFLDNDPDRQKQWFEGVPVLGSTDRLENTCRERFIGQVIIAQPALCPRELRNIVEICHKARIESKILPAMTDIISGDVSVQHLRNVEVEDLLGRKPVRLDLEGIKNYLSGRTILVTGAAGSIGSEICRQMANFCPEQIVLFDNAETPLFHIENELRERFPKVKLHTCLNDIRDAFETRDVFARFRPEVVFHAAAYKHVPMSEKNPIEALKNNVLGTRSLADCAGSFGTRHFVMVSTDKAVNPTNVMGASKRAAEVYVQSRAGGASISFVTVRFGNVLGSNGSVVPIFRNQIKSGGPVTVTHPEVTRFFMTIPEAAQLVLQAGSMGHGNEIFLLDMGEPVKILHLAEEMIRLSGLRAYEDIDIVFTGLRPGEKLYEELLLAGEGVLSTTHEKIKIARSEFHEKAILENKVDELERAIGRRSLRDIIKILRDIVPEYQPRIEPSDPVPLFKPASGMLKRTGDIVPDRAESGSS
jgi:FlaA1/EpsC-like NDP-sugar epimerase